MNKEKSFILLSILSKKSKNDEMLKGEMIKNEEYWNKAKHFSEISYLESKVKEYKALKIDFLK